MSCVIQSSTGSLKYRMRAIVILTIALVYTSAEDKRYDNFTLFKVKPRTEEQHNLLIELYESNAYDFWTVPNVNRNFVSMVSSPESKLQFLELMEQYGIKAEIIVENIQESFDEQLTHRNKTKRSISRSLFWTNYQLMENIYGWFDDLAAAHPGVVTVIVAGQSYEGREIKGVKISRNPGRRAFFLEGGMIGADWLSPTTLTYVINQLVNSEDEETRQASLDFDWYIVPITNPDGYQYSQDSVRLWLKNRRPLGGGAFGVDLTKNWNSQWGVSGASHVNADNNYAGHGPFSEIETRTLSRFISTVPLLYSYLSFRSFGQRIVLPFAHTSEPMYNYEDMIIVGRRSVGSLAVRYGTLYLVGNSIEVSDGATGSAADWVKHRFNPPIVATYQLRDTGNFGYALPVAQVLPNCEEVFDSVLALIREALFIGL